MLLFIHSGANMKGGEKPGRTGTIELEQACGYTWGRETEIMLYEALEAFQIFLFIITIFM